MKNFDFPKNIALLIAHPDDETELSAGFLYENTKRGGENYIYCATKGEKGSAYLKEPVADLGKVREGELVKAGEFLGVKKIKVSDIPDGEVAENTEKLEKEMQDFLEEVMPEVVVSFGADGYSGHRDHVALSPVARKLTKALAVRFVEFATPPESECSGFHEFLCKKRKNGSYTECAPSKANIHISFDMNVKMHAMRLHESQYEGLNPHNTFPESIAEHILCNEYFFEE